MSDPEDVPDAGERQVAIVSALAEPTRRALYEFVAGSGGWVTRDQAAVGVGLPRATAAHHLDRLEASGLLEVDYRRLSGRTGPGAGRPAKLYRRASRDFDVTLPPRDYELAGRLLARAVESARVGEKDVDAALTREAVAEGELMAEEMSRRLARQRGDGREARLAAALEVLAGRGYEPVRQDADTVVLRNCPFHRLAQDHAQLVCEMNECMLRSALETFGGIGYAARFEPDEQLCCVRLRRSS